MDGVQWNVATAGVELGLKGYSENGGGAMTGLARLRVHRYSAAVLLADVGQAQPLHFQFQQSPAGW